MNLLLLFIFMNSCHLAQCKMMGHSRATRRAGAEFTITHTNFPLSPHLHLPLPSLLIPHASTCWIWMELKGWKEKREGRRCRGGTFLSSRLPLSPVSHLRRCGTGINGIQEHGEMAAGTMYLCVCKLHGCSRWNSEYSPPRVSICENTHADTQKWWSVNEWGWSA